MGSQEAPQIIQANHTELWTAVYGPYRCYQRLKVAQNSPLLHYLQQLRKKPKGLIYLSPRGGFSPVGHCMIYISFRGFSSVGGPFKIPLEFRAPFAY